MCLFVPKLPKNTTWNLLLTSSKAQRERLVSASLNTEAWTIYYLWYTDSNEHFEDWESLSAVVHEAQTGPVIESFILLWCVCVWASRAADRKLQSAASSATVGQSVSDIWEPLFSQASVQAGWLPSERCTPRAQAINQCLLTKVASAQRSKKKGGKVAQAPSRGQN